MLLFAWYLANYLILLLLLFFLGLSFCMTIPFCLVFLLFFAFAFCFPENNYIFFISQEFTHYTPLWKLLYFQILEHYYSWYTTPFTSTKGLIFRLYFFSRSLFFSCVRFFPFSFFFISNHQKIVLLVCGGLLVVFFFMFFPVYLLVFICLFSIPC